MILNNNMEWKNCDVNEIFEKYSFLLTEEKFQRTDISLNELGCLARNLNHFLSSQSAVTCNLNSVVPKVVELIVSFGLVKTFQESEDRDYGSDDFPFEAENAERCFGHLESILLLHYDSIDTSSKRKFLIQALLLCATHNTKYLWSSKESVALSKKFLRILLEFSKYESLNTLLCDDVFHPTIFKGILKWMRPSLMKNTWMFNPSSCHIFRWLLSHVQHPHLVDYLYDVLPPSFMFSNYFAVPQQVLGIQCFEHILDNVPPSLIKADGIENAIFDALKRYIYPKDIPVIEVIYPCLLKLPMMNIEKVNQKQWFQFDIVLDQLRLHVDMESNPKLRHLFLTQTYLYVKATPCFKHLKKLLHILLRNFTANSIAEEECRVVSLKIIKELIRTCWPSIEQHCLNIMLATLKAIYDIENKTNSPNETLSKEILTLSEDCLRLLKFACPKTFTNSVNESLLKDESMLGANLLKSICEET